MQSIAFAVPILPGKTETDREAMRSVMVGERTGEHRASRVRHGITREAVWLQQTPMGDLAVVYLEADDIASALAGLASSDDPFDQWFRDVVQECHGIDLTQGMAPTEQIVDFSRDGDS